MHRDDLVGDLASVPAHRSVGPNFQGRVEGKHQRQRESHDEVGRNSFDWFLRSGGITNVHPYRSSNLCHGVGTCRKRRYQPFQILRVRSLPAHGNAAARADLNDTDDVVSRFCRILAAVPDEGAPRRSARSSFLGQCTRLFGVWRLCRRAGGAHDRPRGVAGRCGRIRSVGRRQGRMRDFVKVGLLRNMLEYIRRRARTPQHCVSS